jgi:hypothetical protein
MMGFATGASVEIFTGVPTLRQLGLETPNGDLFAALCLLIGGATLFGTARTLYRLQIGDMTMLEFSRYANYFGLTAERVAELESARRKRAGDFTSADKLDVIGAAKMEGTLADEILSVPVGQSTPLNAPAAAAAAAIASIPTQAEFERMYAKEVELTNGRWAMLGFAALIITEAQSGLGLIGQLELMLKTVGVLGTQSGF